MINGELTMDNVVKKSRLGPPWARQAGQAPRQNRKGADRT
jgi:hypothetical protein